MTEQKTPTPTEDAVARLVKEQIEAGRPQGEIGDALFTWALAVELRRVGPAVLTDRLARAIAHTQTVAAKISAAA